MPIFEHATNFRFRRYTGSQRCCRGERRTFTAPFPRVHNSVFLPGLGFSMSVIYGYWANKVLGRTWKASWYHLRPPHRPPNPRNSTTKITCGCPGCRGDELAESQESQVNAHESIIVLQSQSKRPWCLTPRHPPVVSAGAGQVHSDLISSQE